jgi:predicted aldo/keto reductase-like oxidoreductase
MEPLRGGKIVNALPKEVSALWEQAEPKRSTAEWALRWVWNHPQVLLLLSGMSTMDQVQDNLRIAAEAEACEMGPEQLALFDRARKILSEKTRVPCTGCGYCMPCPAGVDIPTCFASYNMMDDGGMKARFDYMRNTGAWTNTPAMASQCVQCGKCEGHCPQHIAIRAELKNTVRALEGAYFKPVVFLARKFMGTKKKAKT